MYHSRDTGRVRDGTEVNECCWLSGSSHVPAGGSQLSTSDMEAGRRHRFIPAERSDGLAALRMPKQAATPGGFL